MLSLIALAGAYVMQPTGRGALERLATAAALSFGVGAASLSTAKNGGTKP